MICRRWLPLVCALSLALPGGGTPPPGQEAALLAILCGARKVAPTAEGYQIVGAAGQRQRAVRTLDGGYSVFGTNGSYRLFRTPTGFGFLGPSNDARQITISANGFSVQSSNGTTRILHTGAGWIDPDSPDHLRVSPVSDGFETLRSPTPFLDGETANARLKQMTLPGEMPGPALRPTQPAPP